MTGSTSCKSQYVHDELGPISEDVRYRKVEGLSISEYDLYKESGVLSLFENWFSKNDVEKK